MRRALAATQMFLNLVSAIALMFAPLCAALAEEPIAAAPGFEGIAWAQPYLETIDTSDITLTGVTALAEDAEGMLWIGSLQGLIRFDGYRYRIFLNNPADPRSLVGNMIASLTSAGDGQLWIGTRSDGVSVYDPGCECFPRAFRHDPQDPDSLGAGAAKAIAIQSDGGVWIGTDSRLSYLAPGATRLKAVADGLAGKEPNAIRALRVTRDGSVWVGGSAGLAHRAVGAEHFEALVLKRNPDASAATVAVTALFEAADGKLWIGTFAEGAAWLDPGSSDPHWIEVDPSREDRLAHPYVAAINQPRTEEIWLGGDGGMARVAAADGHVLQRLRHAAALTGGLASDQVRCMLKDRSGMLWIGAFPSDLQRFNPTVPVASLRHLPSQPATVSAGDLMAILERSDGTLLLGTRGNGIDIYDRKRGLIGGYRPADGADGSLPADAIDALVESPEHVLWARSHQRGVFRLDPGSNRWLAYGAAQGLPVSESHAMLLGSDGALWVGTATGPYRLRADANAFEKVATDGGTDPATYGMAEDHQGRIWGVSLNAGIWVLEAGATQLKAIVADPARADSLSSNSVRALLVDRQGRIWFDTSQGFDRLLRWDGHQASFEHISNLAGRPGFNFGSNLLEDSRGRIWNDGNMIEPDTLRIHPLGPADGIDVSGGLTGSYGRTRDGLFLFGGPDGVVIIDPERFEPWDYQPPVVATGLKVSGRPEALLSGGPILQLGPERSQFTLEFSALDYSDPKQNRYAYRLLGQQEDWIETSQDQRIASYGGLWPGDYTLEVRGSGRTGEWSPHLLRVPIHVAPAYWQTAWFVGLLVLALATSMFAAVRWRTRRLRLRANELVALVEARTSELRDSHASLENTHARLVDTQQQLVLQEKMAALGTLTAGVAHEINNPVNFADGAVQAMQAELTRLHEFLLELAGDEAPPEVLEAIAARFAPLGELAATAREGHQRITRIVQDLRQFTRLDEADSKTVPIAEPILSTVSLVRTRFARIRFDVDVGFNPSIECQPAKLGQVFMSLISNACDAIDECKDARAGVVSIATAGEGDFLSITVTDNGIGMDEATRLRVFEPFFTTKAVGAGSGLGLAIVFGIIRDHAGSLEVSSTPGVGTRFTLRLPLGAAR